MSYATIAMVTDYDCWHPDHDDVTVKQVIAYLTQNAEHAQAVAAEAVKRIPEGESPYASAIKNAVLTDRSTISEASKKKYALLVGKYL